MWNTILLAMVGFCMLAIAGWSIASGDVGQAIMMAGAISGGTITLVVVWRRPDLVVYGLFFAAVTIEGRELHSGLSLTDKIPAFHNLQTILPLPGMIISPVEALALLTIGVLLIKARMNPDIKVVPGPLWVPLTLLLAIILLGVFRGVQAGGDIKIALWGVRSLLLLMIAYVLTTSLIKRPEQVRILFLILVVGVTFKGLIGIWRFVVDFGGRMAVESPANNTANSLMAHEESFFFLLALMIGVLALVYRFPKCDRQLALLALCITVIPMLANQRRVAIAAFVIAIVLLMFVMYVTEPKRRQAILAGLLLMSLIAPVYGVATWNSDSLVAMPTRAIKSHFAPDERDASSNRYRDIENANLRATAAEDPLLGVGFGVPMNQEQILPEIRAIYEWYLHLPHNGFLWLAMTTGLLGLTAFGWLIANAVLKTVAAIQATEDLPQFRALFVLSLLATTMFMMFALYDQGLLSGRICIFIGVQFGLLAMLPRLCAGPFECAESSIMEPKGHKQPLHSIAMAPQHNRC